MTVTNRTFDTPDDTRKFDHGQAELQKVGGLRFSRNTFEPGWKWSNSVKPIVKTESCQTHHAGYVLSGRLHVVTEDGGESDLRPGDVYEVEPGHDAWVVGDKPFVAVEILGAEKYVKAP